MENNIVWLKLDAISFHRPDCNIIKLLIITLTFLILAILLSFTVIFVLWIVANCENRLSSRCLKRFIKCATELFYVRKEREQNPANGRFCIELNGCFRDIRMYADKANTDLVRRLLRI